MAFHLGSLGFLTPFEFNNYQEQVTNVLEGEVVVVFSFLSLKNCLQNFSTSAFQDMHHLHFEVGFGVSLVKRLMT